MSETWLILRTADLLIPAMTLGTIAAPADKWNCHPIANLPVANSGSRRNDNPRQLMPRHVRHLDVWVVPNPTVPITATDSGRPDLQYHPVDRRLRIKDITQYRANQKIFVENCLHTRSSLTAPSAYGISQGLHLATNGLRYNVLCHFGLDCDRRSTVFGGKAKKER